MPRFLFVLPVFALAWLGCWAELAQAATPEPAAKEKLSFERHIRPLLKVHCYHCHGEGDEHKGGLDVRLRRSLVSGGDSGPAIEPGKAARSLLIERVQAGEMPPGDKKLPAAEIALLTRWIDQGAPTARPEPAQLAEADALTEEERSFWSFQPIKRPAVPKAKDAALVRTPIDAFLLEKLAGRGLSFSPEADRRTLVRRAHVDLLGLPPTPEEVDALLADRAPDAWERLIDRLLARPEYGERWGRHWLDVAGYADSDGFTPQDPVRPYAYKYRDYVIRSFNDDKPWNRFILEQLAGDELAGPRSGDWRPEQIEQLVATGFLRMAPDGSGVVPPAEQDVARNRVVADTLKIVSTALLGVSLGCAECHDHKYDPFPQADYYRFRAIFEPALDWKKWRSPAGRQVALATTDDVRRSAELEAEAAKIDALRLAEQKQFIETTFDEEVQKLPEAMREPLRTAFQTAEAKRTPEQKKLLRENPSVNVSGGSLYLYDRPRMAAVRAAKTKRGQREKELVEQAVVKALEPAPAKERAAIRTAQSTPADKRSDEQRKLLEKYPGVLATATTLIKDDKAAADELAGLDREVDRLQALVASEQLQKRTDEAAAIRARKPKPDFVHALTEIAGPLPTTFVFYRGDQSQPRKAVEPGEPRVLASEKKGGIIAAKNPQVPSSGRRLALARQLTDGEHPLVGRVLANRVWLHHFGRGIVGTPSDFGMLGERPTHPELLDWLAREFVDGGWRLKRLHKLIMTSAAYRQRSRRTPSLDTVDPDNRLLGRMNVRRLEAEALRDSILATCGNLSAKRFGPAVPVMPDEVGQIVIGVDTRDTAGRPSGKVVSLGDDVFRRSVYVEVRRSMPLSMLEMFDAPAMTTNCNCEARSLSTVAPQSLILMNSEFLCDQAALMATRVAAESSADPSSQIERAWRLAYGRSPSERELKSALTFLEQQRVALAPGKQAASAKNSKPASDPAKLALANLCQALLSGNEFLYVD